jgi:hypothetical protein
MHGGGMILDLNLRNAAMFIGVFTFFTYFQGGKK